MGISTYWANKLIDVSLRGVAIVAPARVWVSLHTGDPGTTGANEVSIVNWPAYVRMDPAAGGAVGTGFDAAADRHTENTIQMLFPQHDGAANVLVSHFCIWDAATLGNPIWHGELVDLEGDPVVKTVQPSDELIIYPDELDISLA